MLRAVDFRSAFPFPAGVRNFPPLQSAQTGPGHPESSYAVGAWLKSWRYETEHSLLFDSKVLNA